MTSAPPVDAGPGGVPLAALTLAVGAVFALIFIIVHVFGKQFAKDEDAAISDGAGSAMTMSLFFFAGLLEAVAVKSFAYRLRETRF